MTIRKLSICLISIWILLLGAGVGRGQELVAARVLLSEGQVEIRRPSSDRPQLQKIAFKAADELRAGDVITTGRSGRLVLGLSDGSQAVIAAQTTVAIKDLGGSPRTLFHLIRGKTRVKIEKLGGRPNPYRVNTPTAVIAVRGTVFDVLVDGDKTEVFLHEGEVAVTNLRLPDQPVLLSAGQMTRVRLERPPARPEPFKAGRHDATFKTRRDVRNERAAAGERRAAGHSPGPDSEHGSSPASGAAQSDSGRGGFPSMSRSNPNADRGALPPNGSRANENPRGGGRKP